MEKWKVEPRTPGSDMWWVMTAGGGFVAECTSEAQAKQIACEHNAHDALLKTCRELIHYFPDLPELLGRQSREKAVLVIALARDALALVEQTA